MSERVRRHLCRQRLCLGRHTLTGLLGTSGPLFTGWTADDRLYSQERIDPRLLFAPFRQRLTQQLASGAPLVVALGDTRLCKTGSKTYGVKYTRDPLGPAFHFKFLPVQRFIQISMACPAGDGSARIVPSDCVDAPAVVKPRRDADLEACAHYRLAQRETALPKVGADRLCKLRADMDEDGQSVRLLWTTVDGCYTNWTCIKHLSERTRAVGRIRADAKLCHRPETIPDGTGRPRVYGPCAPTSEQLRTDPSVPWQPVGARVAGKRHIFKIKTLAPLRWQSAGKDHDLRLVVVAPLGYRLIQGGKKALSLTRVPDLHRPKRLDPRDTPSLFLAMGYRGTLPRREDPAGPRASSGAQPDICEQRSHPGRRRLCHAAQGGHQRLWGQRVPSEMAQPRTTTGLLTIATSAPTP